MQTKFRHSVLFILFLSFFCPDISYGSHIMGGNLSYTFIGYNAGTNKYTFDITLKMYRYCAAGSSNLPNSLELGVYNQDTANPNADKVRNSIFTLNLVESTFIVPPSANDSCTFLPTVCVEEGIYQLTIALDPTAGGYHLIVDRCCRNGNIGNLLNPGDAGQAYYAFIPPTTIPNSAPVFGLAPVPFICAGDTVTYDNSAFDPDGDSLVYSFETPFNGISNTTQPAPTPPNIYGFPIPVITYNPGFSVTNPFGATGFASINSSTGLTLYLSNNIDFYVVAVEVKEYRNGVLIGITRRDLQLIFISCPVNPPPNIAAVTQPHLQDTIYEGQTICFPITYTDPNGDSLYLTYTGNIFNGAIVNPPATLSASSGLATVTSQFCWTTSCDQGQSTPYQFNIAVSDNGCPAKTTNNAYSILVIPFTTPPISGTDTICGNAITGLVYTAPGGLTGSTYNWVVTNGTQVSGGNTNSITVNWNGTSNGTISVTAISADSCVGNTQTKTVVIKPIPTANAGANVSFCSGSSANIGAGSTSGYSYSWSPSTGLSNSSASNPSVTLVNSGTTPVTTNYIVSVNNSGCSNKDTVAVTVNPAAVAVAGADQSICNGSVFTLGTASTAGYTYAWTPATGISSTSISNPTLTYNNAGSSPDTLNYTVTVTNAYGCTATDNIQIIVRPVPVSQAGVDHTFCSGQTVAVGTGNTSGYSYSWNPSTGISNSTSSNPNLTLTNLGTTPTTIPYVVTTTIFGCSVKDTTLITVNPAAVANAGADQSLCSGSSTITLGTANTSGYIYSWSPSTGLSSTTISNPVYNHLNNGSQPDTSYFSVFVTNTYGCTATDSVRVIVRPVPTANAGNNVIFCSGQSATIGTGSTSGYTYGWSPSSGLSSSAASNPTVTLSNSGTSNVSFNYVVTATWFNCTANDTVVVTVKPLPVSNAGADITLCAGDTLNIGAASTPGYTYAWSPSSGLSSTTISNPVAIVTNPGSVADTIVYTVTTTLNGCTTNDNIQIIINPLPSITGTANPTAVCSGSSATLTASGGVTYSWATTTNPNVSIGSGSSITVNPLTTTSYIVTGSSGVNCDNYDTITVTVNPLPNVQALTPNDSICAGDSITINGSGASSYSWALLTSPGSPFSSNNSIFVGPQNTISYIVTGTDGNGCVNKDTIQIFVNPAPLANSILGTLSVCPGVTGVSYWLDPTTNGSVYNWSVSGGVLTSGQGNDSILVDWDSSGTGVISLVELTVAGCPSDTIQLPVSINVILTPAAPTGLTPICANQADSIVYSCINTPLSTYTWYIQGGNIISGNGTSTVTVDWTLTGPATGYLYYEELSVTADTVCFGRSDSIFVTINPSPNTSAIAGNPAVCVFDSTGQFSVTSTAGSTYNWIVSPGTILSGSGTDNITATWGTSGTYTVYVVETNSYGCPGDTVSKTLTVNPLPLANAGTDVAICDGKNTTLNASGGVNYSWTPASGLSNTTIASPVASPANTTTYTVLVTDGNGCKNTDSVVVTVNQLPPADAGASVPICLNSSTILNASGGTTYEWLPATGLSSTTGANPSASPSNTTTYTVTVTDNLGCSKTDTVTITVNPLPVAVASADSTICNGSALSLSASGGINYSWSPSAGLNNSTVQNPVASPTSTTTYTVTVTDANNCTDTEDVLVNVNDQPVADFEITDSVDCNGVTLYMKNKSLYANNYFWILGNDGATSTEFEPVKFFTFFHMNNSITLVAINNDCTDSLTIKSPITSLSEYLKEAPNVFTPNGDGLNDCFSLDKVGKFKECSQIQIFNRWGKLMYEASNGNECWDGNNKNNGEKCDDGVYFYIIKIRAAELKGTVHLIR